MWPIGLLFLKASSVKQYSYGNNFSGVFDALHQSFLDKILFSWEYGGVVVFAGVTL